MKLKREHFFLTTIPIYFKFLKNILISRLYEQIFAKWLPRWLWSGCPKKLRLLKYEHIIYHFKARDLEILNM